MVRPWWCGGAFCKHAFSIMMLNNLFRSFNSFEEGPFGRMNGCNYRASLDKYVLFMFRERERDSVAR